MLELRGARRADSGFTLVELVVAMVILTIFFAAFTGVVAHFFDLNKRQQARAAGTDVARTMVETLDRQVRYANGINAPSQGGDGTWWVDWRTGSVGKQQTCNQWRVTAAGAAQWRSWEPSLTNPAAAVTPSGWRSIGDSVRADGSSPVFALGAGLAGSASSRQTLTLDFAVSRAGDRDAVATIVTFTAVNTKAPGAPSPAVCQEVPRS